MADPRRPNPNVNWLSKDVLRWTNRVEADRLAVEIDRERRRELAQNAYLNYLERKQLYAAQKNNSDRKNVISTLPMNKK